MKMALVIADAGPIFSLAIVNKLELLTKIFADVRIPKAVWDEISFDKRTDFFPSIEYFFENRVTKINSFNELTFLMDLGESESLILYQELKADFLLIDDKKARQIAESLNANCIGTLGVLAKAKEDGLIGNLKPIFETLIKNGRYYSIDLLNIILKKYNEQLL